MSVYDDYEARKQLLSSRLTIYDSATKAWEVRKEVEPVPPAWKKEAQIIAQQSVERTEMLKEAAPAYFVSGQVSSAAKKVSRKQAEDINKRSRDLAEQKVSVDNMPLPEVVKKGLKGQIDVVDEATQLAKTKIGGIVESATKASDSVPPAVKAAAIGAVGIGALLGTEKLADVAYKIRRAFSKHGSL